MYSLLLLQEEEHIYASQQKSEASLQALVMVGGWMVSVSLVGEMWVK